jgi:hypothetical protein
MSLSIGVFPGLPAVHFDMKPPMSTHRPRTWKTYPPAVIALACSVVLCCPIASLLGAVIGWFALRAIDRSQGAFGGRRVAISAIILGLCMLPIQMILLQEYGQVSTDMLQANVKSSVETVFDVDLEPEQRRAALETVFLRKRGRYPSIAEADAFVEGIASELGAFKSVSIAQLSVSSNFPRPLYVVALVFQFEEESATGAAVCEVHAALDSMMNIRLELLEVTLPEGGLIQLPAADPEAPSEEETNDESAPTGDEPEGAA